jgi:hypothetical protein
MKKVILFIALFSIFPLSVNVQIHSSPAGGCWNNPDTCEDGFTPGSGNEVIVDSPDIFAFDQVEKLNSLM